MGRSWAWHAAIVITAVGMWGVPAAGQQGGSTGGGNTSRNSTTRSVPQPRTDDRRILVIFGQVEMADGGPLPGSVSIERVCNGSSHKEGNTDSKGSFSLQLGGVPTFQDVTNDDLSTAPMGVGNRSSSASVLAGMPSLDTSPTASRNALYGCELRASAPGFISTFVELSRLREEDVSNVGTIFLQRLEKVEGTTISATSYQAPKEAKKAYEHASAALKKNKLEEAQKDLEKAVAAYPKYATAWYDLGRVLQQRQQLEPAQHAYGQAIEADPQFVLPYFPLAQLAAQRKDWKQVAELSRRGLALDAIHHPEGYFYNAVAQYNLGNLDAAEKGARRGERLDQQQQIPRVHLLLSTILQQRKNYAEAADELRTYLKLAPDAPESAGLREQLANLEKLSGKPASAPAPE